MNHYDYIDDYNAGLLTGELLQEFEAAMASDEKLRRLVEHYDEIKSVSEGVLELQLLEEVSSIQQEENSSNNKSRSLNKYFLLAAACLILAATAYFLFENKDQVEEEPLVFADVYREPIWAVTKSIGKERNDKHYVAKGLSTYLTGDLTSAKQLLLDSVQNNTLAHYWLAEMYMAEQEYDSVLVYLPAATEIKNKANRIGTLREWIRQLTIE